MTVVSTLRKVAFRNDACESAAQLFLLNLCCEIVRTFACPCYSAYLRAFPRCLFDTVQTTRAEAASRCARGLSDLVHPKTMRMTFLIHKKHKCFAENHIYSL